MKQQQFEAIVYGRVQGVNFRYYTKREADRLNINGWVANQSDNTVRVVAEGPDDALIKFVDYLHIGPPSAHVDKVIVTWKTTTNDFKNFSVRWQ